MQGFLGIWNSQSGVRQALLLCGRQPDHRPLTMRRCSLISKADCLSCVDETRRKGCSKLAAIRWLKICFRCFVCR